MDKPLVSIIMAAKNEEQYLPECLQSIASQTYQNWELIIIDDGSTDSTMEIIYDFQKSVSNHVEYLFMQNKGTGVCINHGVIKAKGKYVARMDADDVMLAERLEKQVEFLEKNSNIGAVGGSAVFIGENEEVLGIRKNPKDDQKIKKSIEKFGFPIIHPSLMIRYEILKEVKYREIWMASVDLPLWIDLSENANFANLEDVLIKKRIHTNSITGNIDKFRIVEIQTTRVKIQECLKDKRKSATVKLILKQIAILLAPRFLILLYQKRNRRNFLKTLTSK